MRRWEVTIRYREDKRRKRAASLDVEQNLNVVSCMQTDSAESETIVVYPRRLSNGRRETAPMCTNPPQGGQALRPSTVTVERQSLRIEESP